jgi:Domain of Unknown Function (DUF1080)
MDAGLIEDDSCHCDRETKAMRAASSGITLVTFLLMVAGVSDSADDPIAARLATAKESHRKSLEVARKLVLDQIESLDDAARKKGDIELVEKLKAEREDFESKGVVAKRISASVYNKAVTKAKDELLNAYQSAIKDYLRARDDLAAKRITAEKDEFLRSQILINKQLQTKKERPGVKPMSKKQDGNSIDGPGANGTVLAGEWKLENGELVQTSIVGDSTLIFGDPLWESYNLKIRARSEKGNGNCWNFYHYIDVQNHQNLYLERNRTMGLGTVVEGRGRSERVQVNIPHFEWYEVEIRVRGPKSQIFLDGKQIMDHSDDNLHRGRIGLGGKSTAFRVQKIIVTSTTGEILFSGLPRLPSP